MPFVQNGIRQQPQKHLLIREDFLLINLKLKIIKVRQTNRETKGYRDGQKVREIKSRERKRENLKEDA